jgi:hypothetical protein
MVATIHPKALHTIAGATIDPKALHTIAGASDETRKNPREVRGRKKETTYGKWEEG